VAEEHARLLPPVRRDLATTADGDEDLGAAAQGGEKGNADFDVDEGDSEVAYDVDPERLGEYSLEVSHIVMAQEDECRQWMQDAERHLRGTCGSYVCYFMTRLLLLIIFSGFFSMLPVMFKLGNPYDVSKEGVRNNLGYYLAYNGLGWGFLFLTLSLWMHRILDVRLSVFGAVVLPTLFAMGLFFGGTVMLGAPIPLGTLTVGSVCMLVFTRALDCFMIPKEDEDGEEERQAMGGRVLKVFLMLWVQLVVYAALTVVIIYMPQSEMLVSVVFGLSLEIISELADGEDSLFPKKVFANGNSDPRNCARLLPILPIGLHVTFTQFFFPVLGSIDSVVCNAVTTAVMNVYVLRAGLPTLDAGSFRGEAAAQSFAVFLSGRFVLALVQIACPILFVLLLAFNAWGHNAGMFYILSLEELNTEVDGGIEAVLEACAINVGTNLLSAALSACVVGGWLSRNSQGTDLVSHGSDLNISGRSSSDDGESDDDGSEGNGLNGIDLSRFTVLKALWVARKYVVTVLKGNDNMMAAMCGMHPSAKDEQPYAPVKEGEEDEDEQADEEADEERGAATGNVPDASAAAAGVPGQFDLVVMSLACVTTICGVCMVMKHDGMTLKGWVEWLRGNDMPYELCPGLSFESECIARNATWGEMPW
jgi:hypothetical protein